MEETINWWTVIVSVVFCLTTAHIMIVIQLNRFINMLIKQQEGYLAELEKISAITIKHG